MPTSKERWEEMVEKHEESVAAGSAKPVDVKIEYSDEHDICRYECYGIRVEPCGALVLLGERGEVIRALAASTWTAAVLVKAS